MAFRIKANKKTHLNVYNGRDLKKYKGFTTLKYVKYLNASQLWILRY